MSRQEVLQGSGSFDIDVIATALFGPVASEVTIQFKAIPTLGIALDWSSSLLVLP